MDRSLRLLWLLLALSFIASCGEESPQSQKERELPSQIVDNFQMQESQSGKKLYSLTGERAFYYNRRAEIVVMKPDIVFYDSDLEVTSNVVSDSGLVNNRSGDLVAYGHVVVTTQDSTVLRTDSLVWFNRRAVIETDALVHIESPQGTIDGKGLISDADLDKIEIKEEVVGTTPFSVEEEP